MITFQPIYRIGKPHKISIIERMYTIETRIDIYTSRGDKKVMQMRMGNPFAYCEASASK